MSGKRPLALVFSDARSVNLMTSGNIFEQCKDTVTKLTKRKSKLLHTSPSLSSSLLLTIENSTATLAMSSAGFNLQCFSLIF